MPVPQGIQIADVAGGSLIALFKQKTFGHWQVLFAKEDICVEPMLTLKEASTQPQIVAHEMNVQVPHPLTGSQKQLPCPIKFSKYQPQYDYVGGERGNDGEQVLTKLYRI